MRTPQEGSADDTAPNDAELAGRSVVVWSGLAHGLAVLAGVLVIWALSVYRSEA